MSNCLFFPLFVSVFSVNFDNVMLCLSSQLDTVWPLFNVFQLCSVRLLQALFKLHAAGQLRSIVCASYALDETPKALQQLAARKTYGKVIIHPQRVAMAMSVSSKSKL